jgi:hypothetical protein
MEMYVKRQGKNKIRREIASLRHNYSANELTFEARKRNTRNGRTILL